MRSFQLPPRCTLSLPALTRHLLHHRRRLLRLCHRHRRRRSILQERFGVTPSRLRVIKLVCCLFAAFHLFTCAYWRMKVGSFAPPRLPVPVLQAAAEFVGREYAKVPACWESCFRAPRPHLSGVEDV
jgi:hypothetical protein